MEVKLVPSTGKELVMIVEDLVWDHILVIVFAGGCKIQKNSKYMHTIRNVCNNSEIKPKLSRYCHKTNFE